MNTFCPECGFGVEVDEDGLCVNCGATATGRAVDQLFNDLADQLPKAPFQPSVEADAKHWCGSATCPNNPGHIGTDELCSCKRTPIYKAVKG